MFEEFALSYFHGVAAIVPNLFALIAAIFSSLLFLFQIGGFDPASLLFLLLNEKLCVAGFELMYPQLQLSFLHQTGYVAPVDKMIEVHLVNSCFHQQWPFSRQPAHVILLTGH